MLGRQHLTFGISTAVAAFLAAQGSDVAYFEAPFVFFAGTALGSLAPDLDSKTSTLGQKMPFVPIILNFVFDILDVGKKASTITLSNGITYRNHRRYLHDPAIWIPIAIVFTTKHPVLFGFFWGYLGHLFLDSFTSGGMPLFYLIHKKLVYPPYHLKFKSNSTTAKIATIVLSVAAVSFIWVLKDRGIVFG